MKNYKIKKITRQYNGHKDYKWLIECSICDEIKNRQDLSNWREWCWQTWGPSRELLWAITSRPVPVWAWNTEFHHRRLYLKGDEELTMFELRWG